jgi:hypothetical protein
MTAETGGRGTPTEKGSVPAFRRAIDDRGQVVITRFDCRTVRKLVRILALHYRVKPQVRRRVDGYLGSKTVVLWRQRTVLSISLWRDLSSIYQMGNVSRHILATRVPGQLGVTTLCGIYAYNGDWKYLMFGTPSSGVPEPLHAGTAECAGRLTKEETGNEQKNSDGPRVRIHREQR